MQKRKLKKNRMFKFIVMFLAALIGFSLVTMLLWNALLPDIFQVARINFWQALGLLVLSRMLFGGLFGKLPKPGRGHFKPNHLHKKWSRMTPAERKAFWEQHVHAHHKHARKSKDIDPDDQSPAEDM